MFTQLDMSQAYQQLPLDEKSKSYVVVNTHRGLFRYNRLPYGVSSAPGIFQRTMEILLLAELLMGRKLRSPLDLIKPDLNHRVEKEQERQKAAHDQHSTVRTFKVGDAVYARNFGPGPKWLPVGIVEGTGPLSWKVKLLDGKVWRRHQDHLRKRYESDSQTQISNSSNISSTEQLTDHSPMFPLEFPTRHSPDATSRNSTPSNETSTPDSNTIPSPRYHRLGTLREIDNLPIGIAELVQTKRRGDVVTYDIVITY